MYEDEGLQIGAFVVKFAITGPAAEDRDIIGSDPPAETTVVKLDREVIARRMQQHLASE